MPNIVKNDSYPPYIFEPPSPSCATARFFDKHLGRAERSLGILASYSLGYCIDCWVVSVYLGLSAIPPSPYCQNRLHSFSNLITATKLSNHLGMRAIIPKHGFRILDYTISLGLFFNTSLECVREGDRCRGDGCTLTIRVRKMRPNYGGREWIKFEALIYIFLLRHPNKVACS